MKIFGIGLNKTGTTTLGAVGERFGLRVKSWDAALFRSVIIDNERERLWKTIEQFDVLNDFPYPLIYRELDARYRDAKFILTERASAQQWLASIKAHSMRASPGSITHKTVYGFRFAHGKEDLFIDYYNQHNAAARAYFENRRDDFMAVCWEEEPDLTRIAAILGRPAPEGPPPHANAKKSKLVNPLRYGWNRAACFVQNR